MPEMMDTDRLWALIEQFERQEILIDAFEREFLDTFRGDDRHLSEGEFKLLDWFFAKVDSYCGDPALFDPDDDIDEGQLRQLAREALEKRNNPTPSVS